MKEHPINLTAHEVLAILAGRMTQIRRPVKPQPVVKPGWSKRDARAAVDGIEFHHGKSTFGIYAEDYVPLYTDDIVSRYAPWKLGDRLWAREAWRSWKRSCTNEDVGYNHVCGPHCNQTYVAYAATPRQGYRPVPDRAQITYLDETTPLESNPRLRGPWRSSVHMSRWASRITLEVTDLRAERVQAITEEDAKACGAVPFFTQLPCIGRDQCLTTGERAIDAEHRAGFAVWWDEVHGDDANMLWKSDPWVWVANFRRVETPPT